jgi:alpha-N-arabinofuranosidase
VRTPNYHVQSLFARNRGDRVLPATMSGSGLAEEKRLYASATLDEASGEVVVKLVNANSQPSPITVTLSGVRQLKGGTLTVLQAGSPEAVNTFAAPDQVVPQETVFAPQEPTFTLTLPATSFSVVRVGTVR